MILNIASVNGLMAIGESAYSAAKAGMISLTGNMAIHYGDKGVRVVCIAPGTIETPIWSERLKREPNAMDHIRPGIRWAGSASRTMSPRPRSFSARTTPRGSPGSRCQSMAVSPPARTCSTRRSRASGSRDAREHVRVTRVATCGCASAPITQPAIVGR